MTTSAHLIGALTELCRGVLQVGIGLALQSTLLLLVGVLAGRLMRGHGPAVRAAICRVVLAAVTLSVLLSALLGGRIQPGWALALPPAPGTRIGTPLEAFNTRVLGDTAALRAALTGGPGLGMVKSAGARVTQSRERFGVSHPAVSDSSHHALALSRAAFPAIPTSTIRLTWLGWVYIAMSALWAGGAAWLLAGITLGSRAASRLRRAGAPVAGDAAEVLRQLCEDRRLRLPMLRASADIPGPVLIGPWRPAILLPGSYDQDFDPPALRVVLAHELAHLARGDCGWILLGRLACAAGWVQPLLWALCRRLEQSSEEACDQEALRQGGDPRAYARCLVELAERRASSRLRPAAGAAMVPCRSSLEQRVRALLSPSRHGAAPLSPLLRAAMAAGTLAVVGLGVVLAAAAAPAERASKGPLAADPRLAQKVRATVEGLSVGDVLSLLSAKTGVPLTASRETADDKVMIFSPARPLRDVLADLAALFNDRWEHRKAADHSDGYVLVRDLAAQRYEAALANAATVRMMAQLAAQVRALDETPEQLAQRPENDPVRRLLSDEVGRMGTTFYAALSQGQHAALFAGRRLDIPFSALEPQYQAPLRAAFARRIALEQELARQVQEQHPGRRMLVDRPEDLEKGLLRFRIQRTGGFVSVGMALGAIPLAVHVDPDNNQVAISGWPIALLDSRTEAPLPPHGDPYTAKGIPADAPLPGAAAIRAAAAEKGWPDRLRKLAETTGLPVLADYYRGKPIASPPDNLAATGGPDTSATALDTMCQPTGYLWWVRGKTLLLRKRDWYRQQRYEVPDRWMAPAAEHLSTEKGIPTGADALRVLELTPDQIAGLESLPEDPYVEEPGVLDGLLELLAIVQASPRDRTAPLPVEDPSSAAEGPATLRFSEFTAAQRRLFAAFLEAQEYPASPEDVSRFSVRLSRPPHCPAVSGSGYRYAPVEVEWSFGSDASRRSLALDLPASLPDDRRDQTRIAVAP